MSTKITAAAEDEGVCKISTKWGAVCLLRNTAGDGLMTYRLSYPEWQVAITDDTGTAIIAAIKANADFKKDPANDNDALLWMDGYYCADKGSNVFQCTGYQPNWNGEGDQGVSPGYPRFGEEESDASELFYAYIYDSGA